MTGSTADNWRFWVPTVHGSWPDLTFRDEHPPAASVSMVDDNWRQCELLAGGLAERARAICSAVERIRQAASPGEGYLDCVVREGLEAPLDGVGLVLDDLRRAIGASPAQPGPVMVEQRGGYVKDGYVLPSGTGVFVYGRTSGPTRRVEVLAFCDDRGFPAMPTDPAIFGLVRALDLVLVDWPRAELQHLTARPGVGG